MQVNFLEKLPKLVALQNFQTHISVVGNPSTTILYPIIIRGTLNIFLKTLHILQKDTKVGSQNFGYQIWFCTRLIGRQLTWYWLPWPLPSARNDFNLCRVNAHGCYKILYIWFGFVFPYIFSFFFQNNSTHSSPFKTWSLYWNTKASKCSPLIDSGVFHYSEVIMGAIASQIISLTIVYSDVYSGANQRKHQMFPFESKETSNVSIWWRHHVPCGLELS